MEGREASLLLLQKLFPLPFATEGRDLSSSSTKKGLLLAFSCCGFPGKYSLSLSSLFHAAEKGQKEEEEEEEEGGDLSQLLAPEEGGVEVVGEGQQTGMEEE